MFDFPRLVESIWRGGTYARFAALLGVLLVGVVTIREAPIVRSLAPVRQVAPRQALIRQGRIIRFASIRSEETAVANANRTARAFVVEMTAVSDEHWQLAPADLRLEFDDGVSVSAIPPDLSRGETSLIFAPGTERTAVVRFLARGDAVNVLPVSILLHRPRARFMLESG